jgi:hypothetical protein
MICGKGAAAACSIALNEEQFEACCGGIRARYQRQSQQPLLHGTNPPGPLYLPFHPFFLFEKQI